VTEQKLIFEFSVILMLFRDRTLGKVENVHR